MGFTATGRAVMLGSVTATARWVSLHSDNPGDNGSHEIRSTRQLIEWAEPEQGQVTNRTHPLFDVPARSVIEWVGFWSARDGGTFHAFSQVPREVFNGTGSYLIGDVTFEVVDG